MNNVGIINIDAGEEEWGAERHFEKSLPHPYANPFRVQRHLIKQEIYQKERYTWIQKIIILMNLLKLPEGTVLEFKTAKNSFNVDKDLPDYCAAISNEGGGKLILGVGPDGKVAGTNAFKGTYNKLSHDLFTKIKIRVDVEELLHPEGRVLIFHIPPRSRRRLIRSTGVYTYPMRAGESLV